MKLTALLIGRSDCIADALRRSPRLSALYVISDFGNPGLAQKADKLIIEHTSDAAAVARHARRLGPDFAIVGSEEPLAKGVVDQLLELGIPCVGPTQALARLESSKAFTRELLSKYGIPANPEYEVFRDEVGLKDYLRSKPEYVVKPDGLTGGKGVKVFGDHLSTTDEALAYCRELFAAGHDAVLIEEKLDGEEFSFQSFYDGANIAHTIPVQDHKRAFVDDRGPNTGGMGSYSCGDHLLPFLSRDHVDRAAEINRLVGLALLAETGAPYKGILYGGFMLTSDGVRVIEYNARFGDPEVMNVLSLLETDFVEICMAIIEGTLDQLSVTFRRQASVCKYLVPDGYPARSAPSVGTSVDLGGVLQSSELGRGLRLYYGAVNEVDGQVLLTDSRALALVGVAPSLAEAERIAETAASSVGGRLFHRRDVGTPGLIQKRVDHMNAVWRTPARQQMARGGRVRGPARGGAKVDS